MSKEEILEQDTATNPDGKLTLDPDDLYIRVMNNYYDLSVSCAYILAVCTNILCF